MYIHPLAQDFGDFKDSVARLHHAGGAGDARRLPAPPELRHPVPHQQLVVRGQAGPQGNGGEGLRARVPSADPLGDVQGDVAARLGE